MQSICVYCGSSSKVSPVFFEAAAKFGSILASNNISLIYGGGSMGLMGEVANSTLQSGGKVKGIIPQFMYDENWFHPSLTELIIVDTMHQRKAKMIEMSDAIVALPGGCGTFEELLEAITWKQLGLITKPIIILNTHNYYSPLLEMFNESVEENFMRDKHLEMWTVLEYPEEILPTIKKMAKWDENYRKFAAI